MNLSCNKACELKLIWMLFFSSGFIWVAWFIKEILSGSVSNFWTLSVLDGQLNALWEFADVSEP